MSASCEYNSGKAVSPRPQGSGDTEISEACPPKSQTNSEAKKLFPLRTEQSDQNVVLQLVTIQCYIARYQLKLWQRCEYNRTVSPQDRKAQATLEFLKRVRLKPKLTVKPKNCFL